MSKLAPSSKRYWTKEKRDAQRERMKEFNGMYWSDVRREEQRQRMFGNKYQSLCFKGKRQ